MKIQAKLLHLSLILGVLAIPLAPSAQAWPNANKAIKDAKKAGKKASKKASKASKKASSNANKQASNAVKKAKSSVKKANQGKKSTQVVDVCKTPSPAGPVPIPYPNITQGKKMLKNAQKGKNKAQKTNKKALDNYRKQTKSYYKSAQDKLTRGSTKRNFNRKSTKGAYNRAARDGKLSKSEARAVNRMKNNTERMGKQVNSKKLYKTAKKKHKQFTNTASEVMKRDHATKMKIINNMQ